MKLDKSTSIWKFGILGGIIGGLIALVGYLIMSPPTDSLTLFILLRVGVGAIVAMIFGPLMFGLKK